MTQSDSSGVPLDSNGAAQNWTEDVFVFPASYAQQRLWFFYRLTPDSPLYNSTIALRLSGVLKVPVLAEVLNEIVRRHEILRTTFPAIEGQAAQVVSMALTMTLPVVDLRTLPESERETQVRHLAAQEASRLFVLAQGPLLRAMLLRLSEKEHVFLLTMHHIIADGWSAGVFMQELVALYEAFSIGKSSPLPELPIQYADFALWQREWLQGQVLQTQLAYWREQLANVPTLKLPTDHPRPAVQTFQGMRYSLVIPQKLISALKTLSERQEATLFMTLLAAFQVLLHRYTAQDDIVVGSPIANRNRVELERLIGFFANTLVLRTDLTGNPTFRELLGRVQKTCAAAYAHQDLPFEKLVEELQPERDLGRNPLFQVFFALQSAPLAVMKLGDLTLNLLELESGIARFDLELHLSETPQGLYALFVYNTDLFDTTTVARMAGHFETLLGSIAAEPDRRLGELALLTAAERRQLLVEWNPTPVHYPTDRCLHQLFEVQVERAPRALAVVFGEERLTYQELNQRANQLAHHLQALGVGPQVPVGIYVERSLEEVIGLLGILKAGGGYVPLGAKEPQKRLAFILQDAQIPVVLTLERLIADLPPYEGRVVCLDSDWEVIEEHSQGNPVVNKTAESLAYILYSQSRGILVEHRGVCNCLQWLQQEFALTDSEAVLHQTSLTQAASVWEIFWPLTCGGEMVIAAIQETGYLQRLIVGQNVGIAHLAPSALAAFLESWTVDSADAPHSLRWVLCSGELLKGPVVEAFFERLNCGLYYFYSPPEAATAVTAQTCHPGAAWDTWPIGYPVQNVSLYVLDKYRQPVPIGVSGEIYVTTEGLARGYLYDTWATGQCFVQHPFSATPGERLFKTGDLGRWRSDGALELVGTAERQIWLGGSRIELAEVEAALLAEPSVSACAVMARETEAFGSELVAYVVPAGPFLPERLQTHLEGSLPPIMQPRAYVPLSTLPLTPDGRVDESVLTRQAALDTVLLRRWQDRLHSLPGIDQVAVVVEEHITRQPVWHLTDLLPEWSGTWENVTQMPSVSYDQAGGQALAAAQAMAWNDGGPLSIPSSAPQTLTEALLETARIHKDKGVLVVQSDGTKVFQNYGILLEKARCILMGLYEKGLRPGDRVILQIEALQDHFVTFWGCVLGGIKPVTVAIAPTYTQVNAVVSKLHNVWELLGHPTILANQSLVESLAGLETSYGMKGLNILSVEELQEYPPAEQIHPSQPHDVVFYQLTSGSTGIPKCIQETHRAIIAHIHGSAQFNGYTPDDVTLNWLPMDHVVPILTFHFKDVYLGCQQIHVKTEFILSDPLRWLDLMAAYRVTHTWSPNFGFKLVSDRLAANQERVWDLGAIKFFMNAGEQVTLPVVRDFLHALAPFGVRQQAMQPAFGMAEVCTCMTYQNDFDIETGGHRALKSSLGSVLQKASDDDDEAATVTFIDLGPPIPGVQIRIADADNRLLPEGVIGRFQIKGNVLTPGYLYNDAANRESFVGDGWFNSGDLGFILDGRLTLTGREKEMIIVRGANFYCYEIEDVVNNIEGVEPTFAGACAVEDERTGTEGLAIFFVPKSMEKEALADVIRTIRTEVTAQLGIAPMFIVPLTRDRFAKTTSGKIQRAQMQKSLAAGEYQEILKEVDLLLENANTLPAWFYRKVWRRKEAPSLAVRRGPGLCLVFLDPLGLGTCLCAEMARFGQACIGVEAGEDFARLGSDRYRINPGEPEHYGRLLASIAEGKRRIERVLHLWTYDEYTAVSSLEALEQAQDCGVYGLLFLAQALARTQDAEQAICLYVVSSYMQPISSGDKIAYQKAPMLGLIETIPQEMPWLNCCHVDLPLDDIEKNMPHVFQEMQTWCGDRQVAYRNGQRLVVRLERVDLSKEESQPLPFRPGGMYLLSGGLGGLGIELARYLLENYGVHLLLVGRTCLPERSFWQGHFERGDGVSERIEALLALEQLGGQVAYESVDICDFEQLQFAVDRARSRWQCKLDGVIHLAGVFHERLLVEESRESLAAVLRPKVLGTWVLNQLLEDKGGVFISFSSVNGFFGGVTVGAYAAANSFLDCFAGYQRYENSLSSHCFAWSLWDEAGIGRDYQMKDLTRARGYHTIETNQGLHSLFAGLYRGQLHLLVGLDGSNPYIRRHVEMEAYPLQKLVVYFTAQDARASLVELQQMIVQDRFATQSRAEFRQVQQIPLTDTGEIDLETLIAVGQRSRRVTAERVAPRTDLERHIADIWQQVLQKEVGVYDNFFDLGGHSLLATQVMSRLYEAFQVEFPPRQLFETPTIAGLAQSIEAIRWVAQGLQDQSAVTEGEREEGEL